MVKNTSLVVLDNDTPLTTSRKVAEQFDKPHNDVMKSIRRLIADLGGVGKISQSSMFAETTYTNKQNKQQPMYTMTRDGFTA